MKTLAAFLLALQSMESGGDYQIVNSLNYLGAYQFGEAALTDLGYVRFDGDATNNDYAGGWTGKDGIRSASDFLSSREVQDQAAQDWLVMIWGYLEDRGLHEYAGREVGGVRMTASGLLAATHLLGPDSVAHYVASNGADDLRDPYGTPISTYMVRLADYDIPWAPSPTS